VKTWPLVIMLVAAGIRFLNDHQNAFGIGCFAVVAFYFIYSLLDAALTKIPEDMP
jgi:hypothetical protein